MSYFFLRQQFLRHVNDLPQLALRPEGKSHFFNKRIGRNRLGNKVVRPDFVKQHEAVALHIARKHNNLKRGKGLLDLAN